MRALSRGPVLTQSHRAEWFPKVYSLSTTWKSIPNCFSVCGIPEGLQCKRTVRRNTASYAWYQISSFREKWLNKETNEIKETPDTYPNLLDLKKKFPLYWSVCVCVCVCSVYQSCPTLCNPMDCSLPGSSVHGIFQARILEWVAISFSRGSANASPASAGRAHLKYSWSKILY